MKNYYEILEVSPKASKEIIDKAYKVLAKKYHPDIHTGDSKRYAEEKIKEINEAYKILSDEFFREQYDNELLKENQTLNGQNLTNRSTINDKMPKKNIIQKQVQEYKGVIYFIPQILKTLIEKIKDLKKADFLALGLTILVMLVLGVTLWVLPFTHDWFYNNFINIFK